MELNRKRIIQGLECCKGSYDCFTCDIYKRGCAGFRTGMAKDALSLIKELTEDNEKLQNIIFRKEDLMQMIAKQKQTYYDELVKAKEENERLMDECGNQSVLWKQHFESIYETAKDTLIADTVRKMHSEIEARCIEGGIYPAFVKSAIDQIAKEMVEGE